MTVRRIRMKLNGRVLKLVGYWPLVLASSNDKFKKTSFSLINFANSSLMTYLNETFWNCMKKVWNWTEKIENGPGKNTPLFTVLDPWDTVYRGYQLILAQLHESYLFSLTHIPVQYVWRDRIWNGYRMMWLELCRSFAETDIKPQHGHSLLTNYEVGRGRGLVTICDGRGRSMTCPPPPPPCRWWSMHIEGNVWV